MVITCREHVLFVKTLMTVKTNATPRPIVGSDHLNGLNGLNGHNCREQGYQQGHINKGRSPQNCIERGWVSAKSSNAILRDDV